MMTKISEVFDLQMGKTPSRKNLDYWIDGNTDWVSISDLGTYEKYVGKTKEKITQQAIDESGIKAVPKNTVLMSFKLSIGISAITREEKTYTNEAVMAFIDKGEKSLFPDYFYHQFRTKDWLENTSKAVMGSTLNKSKLSNCIIKVPDLDEQKHVANVLDTVCRLILIKKDLCKKLDDLVKSRFMEMFGDPVADVIWPCKRLDEICTIVTGNTPSRKDPSNYGDCVEWCKTDNITDAKYLTAASEMLSEKGASKGRVVPAGSILMACIAGSVKSIGKVAVADRSVAFNQQINALVLSEKIDVEYLLWALRLSKDYLCSGVNMQLKGILNKTSLSAKRFCVPPLSLQQEFANFVAQVDKLKFETQQSIEKLQMLYDSLAQEYFAPEGE